MNKRFFTLMAAVMLAGSPFAATEAFAAKSVVEYTNNTAALANGMRFFLGTADGALLKVADFTTKEGQKVVTLGTADGTVANASQFVIRNYKVTAAGATFELWVGNKLFVTKTDGAAATGEIELSKLNTAFAVTSGKANFTNLYTAAFPAVEVLTGLKAFSVKEDVDAAYLNDYNSKGTTLSFDYSTSELVGNLFSGLIPVTTAYDYTRTYTPEGATESVTLKLEKGTYFVSGDEKKIKAFVAAVGAEEGESATSLDADEIKAIFDAAAEVSFLAVDPSVRYNINGKQPNEGYQLYKMAGTVVSKQDSVPNANFTISTVDNFNKDGELHITVKPNLKYDGFAQEVLAVQAVLPSSSDTKTYVTTVKETGTQFTSVKNPTLGANTYLKPSVLLKTNQENVVNVYFTSNDVSFSEQSSAQTEYHKYLIVDPTNTSKLVVRPLSKVDFSMPTSQWIVSAFNGKYGFTLTNRATGKALFIELQPDGKEGGYFVKSATYDENAASITNGDGGQLGATDATAIKGTSVKFNTIPTTRTDGALELTAEQLASGIKLQFNGANSVYGAKTQYAGLYGITTSTDAYTEVRTSGDAEEADVIYPVRVKGANNHAVKALRGAADYVIKTTTYAYLDANGNVVYKSEGDTLVVPTYALQVNKESGEDARYIYNYDDTGIKKLRVGDAYTDVAEYAFVKNASGAYSLAVVADAANGSASYSDSWKVLNTEPSEPRSSEPIVVSSVDRFSSASWYLANYANVTISAVMEENVSLPAVARHATLDNKLGSINFQANKADITEGILAAEGLTFWLDTADSKNELPAFYISKGIAAETKAAEDVNERMFMFNPQDSLYTFVESTAQVYTDTRYFLEGAYEYDYDVNDYDGDTKVIFRPAVLEDVDVLATTVEGEAVKVVKKAEKAGEVTGLDNFKFYIVLADDEEADDEYVIASKSTGEFVYSLNGKLGFTSDLDKALVITLGEGDPTANEAIEAAGVQVIAGQGVVTVQGAAGKVITVANILGQTIANQVAASDNVTIAAPAGIVVVSVDGEATKVIVK